jgi:hypothetical protein
MAAAVIARLRARLSWWRGALAYDKETRQRYVLAFTIGAERCFHRSHRLGARCVRYLTYDGWCGLHNSLCHTHDDRARCDGVMLG